MICKKCKRINKEGASYCVKCGSVLVEDSKRDSGIISETDNKPKGNSNITTVLLGIIAVVLIVNLGVVGWFVLTRDSGNAAAENEEKFGLYVDEGEEESRVEELSAELTTEVQREPVHSTPEKPPENQLPVINEHSWKDEYIIYDSDKRYLTVSDLSSLSSWELRIARNEIYARHGRRFKDESLQAYFDGCSWYRGTIAPDNFDSSVFNQYEIKNKDFILSYEQGVQ